MEKQSPQWQREGRVGVEGLRVAVMGCIVNGPGEARDVNIGLSLPGVGETPSAPVFIDGKQSKVLKGTREQLSAEFIALINQYVESHYKPGKEAAQVVQ